MKYTFLLACALVLTSFAGLTATEPVTITSKKSGVSILFKNPEIALQGRTGFPRITNIDDVEYIAPDSAALENISFTLAIPAGSEPNATLKTFRFKTIDNFSAPASFKNVTENIRISHLGIKRGVHLVRVELQPYAFKNGKLMMVDSALIDIDFGVNIPAVHKSQISEVDAGFFTGIKNQEQLHNIFEQSLKTNRKAEKLLKAENNWYDPGKNYVRIATTRDGVAKISMRDVLAAQPAFKGKNSGNFHLNFKGEEYPFAFINDENAIADDNDEIIFLGKRAAGDTTWFDTYTNEAVFYLTYDESAEGNFLKQMPQLNTSVEISKVNVKYHFEEDHDYSSGDINGPDSIRNDIITLHESKPVRGEGFYWKMLFNNGESFTTEIPIHPTGEDPLKISLKLHAAGNHLDYNPDLVLSLLVNGNKVDSAQLNGEQDYFMSATVPASQLRTGLNTITFISDSLKNPFGIDTNKFNGAHVDFITVEGVAKPKVLNGTSQFTITAQQDAFVKINGFKNEKIIVIDPVLKEFAVLQTEKNGAEFSANVFLKGNRSYSIVATDLPETVSVSPASSTDLLKTSNQADVLIITHNNFKSEAQKLAEYRAKTRGLKVLVADVEDVFKEFDFGRHSPFALKSFLQHAYDSWQKPAPGYVIMFGDASWDPRKVTNDATQTDFVPVFGRPVSDFWYTLLEGDDYLSEMHIGRLPASTPGEAKAIVNKIIEYDTLAPQPWMKKFMAIVGGFDLNEAAGLHDHFAGQVSHDISNPAVGFGGDTAMYSRYIPDVNGTGIPHYIPREDVKGTDIIGNNAKKSINEGTVWVSYMGHGSPQVTEIGNWMPDQIANGSRYFFLNTFSCQTGAFAEPIQSINEQFIRAEDKGAVAAFGTTAFGYVSVDGALLDYLVRSLIHSNIREYGLMIDEAKQRLANFSHNPMYANTIMQYSLLGDPLTRFPFDTTTDLYFVGQDVQKKTLSGLETFTVDDDSVQIATNLRNNGISYGFRPGEESFMVSAIHELNGARDTIQMPVQLIGFKTELQFSVPVFSKPGTHTITLIADPDTIVNERRRDNNILTFSFEVYEKTPLALDPLALWDVNADEPVFRIINPFKNSGNDFDYDFAVVTEDTVSPQNIIQSSTRNGGSGITVTETYVEWQPDISLPEGRGYTFQARLYNRSTEQESKWLTIPFTAGRAFKNDKTRWSTQSRKQLGMNRIEELEFLKTDSLPALGLKVKNIPVRVVSVGFPRSASIEVGDDYQGSNTDQDGIYISVYSPNDTVVKYKNHYTDMWQDWADNANGVMNTDNIIKLFASDTIAEGDYVMVTFAEGLFRGALRDSATTTRYTDFKNAFKSIGSALIDSFQIADSYAIFGRRGMKQGEAIEVWNGTPDSLIINSFIPFVAESGRVETAVIGPAKKWDSVAITGSLPLALKKWNWTVSALDKTKSSGKVLFSGDSLQTLTIDSLSAQDYPFLKMEVTIPKEIQDEPVFLNSFKAAFEPEAELALLPSQMNMEPYVDILRGDSTVSTVAFKNISRRSSTPLLKANFDIKALNGSPQVNSTHILPELQPDEEIVLKDTVGTSNFTLQSTVTLSGDTEKALNELYLFNNTSSYPMTIADDTIAPVIDLFVDDREVAAGDLIQLRPSVLIRIWDNSRLPVDARNTEIRINGGVLDSADYFQKFHRQIPRIDTTGEFRFIPLELENGENSFIITATDASGNTAEKRVKLIVSMSYSADNIKNSPNPFSDGTTFSFQYKGQELTVPGKVEIHNLSGQKVRDINFTAELGENTFFWDGFDNNGTQLPAGMYFYKIQLQGLINAESVYGKCVIIR